MANEKNFTGKASAYLEGRPNYSKNLFDYLVDEEGVTKEKVFADIGSGTGKFTENLLRLGNKVFAVEPNYDMRKIAEQTFSSFNNFISIDGNDSDFNIKDKVDYITVAQAFHWFDTMLFKEECKRVLKKDGKIILVWNRYNNEKELIKELFGICKKFCPKFKGFSAGISENFSSVEKFFDEGYKVMKFQNDLNFTEEKFIKRMLSSSYSLNEIDKEYEEYIKSLKEYFYKFRDKKKILTMPNETIAYISK